MKIPAILLSLLLIAPVSVAQLPGDYRSTTYSSVNDWKTVNTWEKFITYPDYWLTPTQAPSVIRLNANVTILSYVDLVDNLGFQNSNIILQVGDGAISTPNDPYKVSDYKVLVIRGDVDITNQKPKIVIKENGIMIILGNLIMGNKTVLENDGFLVVDGTLSFGTASGKAIYSEGDPPLDPLLFLPDGNLSVDPDDLPGGNDASNAALDFDQLCDITLIPGFDVDDPRREILPAICAFIQTGGNNPLPVELLSFNASINEFTVTLAWQTASELNNDYFTLLRSVDGINYKEIGKVDGSGTTNEAYEYEYVDEHPMPGISYYRLTQTDFDGTTELLGTVPVNFALDGSALRAYPNPFSDGVLNIRLTGLEKNKPVRMEISDLTGKSADRQIHNSRTGRIFDGRSGHYGPFPRRQLYHHGHAGQTVIPGEDH